MEYYFIKEKVRGNKGYFEYNYLIYEKTREKEKVMDKNHPDVENYSQINTNKQNTKKQNTNKKRNLK